MTNSRGGFRILGRGVLYRLARTAHGKFVGLTTPTFINQAHLIEDAMLKKPNRLKN